MAITVTRKDPFAELVSLRDVMGRLFDESFVPWGSGFQPEIAGAAVMPLDLHEESGNYIIRAYLPGVKAEDIEISADKNTVTIKAEIPEEMKEEKDKDRRYLVRELRYGQVARSLSLPAAIDADKIEAAMENGVLSVTIPRAEEARPKQIAVKFK